MEPAMAFSSSRLSCSVPVSSFSEVAIGRQFLGELRLVDVEADAGQNRAMLPLGQDAAQLAVADQHVVGPAQVARDAGEQPERVGYAKPQRERDQRHLLL